MTTDLPLPSRSRTLAWGWVFLVVAALFWGWWVWSFWLGNGANWFEQWWPLIAAVPFTVIAVMYFVLALRLPRDRDR